VDEASSASGFALSEGGSGSGESSDEDGGDGY
jgi:hypothetical protein